ncbi:MAG: hypothetical protein R3176_06895 [Woeseiaceae bacterium]|nr:hypothetical protein [Woeseiaceae bacterium]
MRRRAVDALVAGLLLAVPAAANGAPEPAAAERSPYAGQETRAIKTLSAGGIEALEKGEGMGFAKAAELNGYPGPRHVLDLAEQLGLTAEQHRQTTELFETMRSRAIALGARLVEAEAALDDLFASGTANKGSLERAVETAATIRGELRLVHLDAHLVQARILSPRQLRHYAKLRGYHGGHGDAGDDH